MPYPLKYKKKLPKPPNEYGAMIAIALATITILMYIYIIHGK
jgi:hypothetical protein